MKYIHFLHNLHTLKKGGSLVFCSICEKIIASINQDSYKYIKLDIDCSCGNHGSLEFSSTRLLPDFDSIKQMPYEKDGLAICKNCKTKMFGVIPHRTSNYSFYIECKCGEKYNIKPTFEKRLGETLKQLEQN